MKVVVVGGGKVAIAVARSLVGGDHTVTLVESDQERADELRAALPMATVVVGNGTDHATLESAGIREVDAVAALTGRDETNLLAAGLAKFAFGVRRTIVRTVDPRHAWLHTTAMGVDIAVDQAQLIASLVAEELSLGEMTTLLKLRRGQFALIEERVHPTAAAVGHAIRALPFPPESVVCAVLRPEGPIVPTEDVILRPGDEVLAIVRSGSAPEIARLLGEAPTDAR